MEYGYRNLLLHLILLFDLFMSFSANKDTGFVLRTVSSRPVQKCKPMSHAKEIPVCSVFILTEAMSMIKFSS